MSAELIARSSDLKQLRDEGYEIEVRDGHVLLTHVPYLTAERQVALGILVSALRLSADATAPPDDHTILFAGQAPCDENGTAINIVADAQSRVVFDGLETQFRFSSKPSGGAYSDYHSKMTTYANILGGPARAIDPKATARTFKVVEDREQLSVFHYIDTASSRAGITAATQKLAIGRVAIVGLGGTGSYVLDLVAKTPVGEIHLYDGDFFFQHNAFRAPGAPSIDQLAAPEPKVDYLHRIYSKMRRGLIPHATYIDESNLDEVTEAQFVFLCIDGGPMKKTIVSRLQSQGIPFVDVGMSLALIEEDLCLTGLVRATSSTPRKMDHFTQRVSFAVEDAPNDYEGNVQVADLNALNAALAVIKWKKWLGFYADLESEHHSVYSLDGNHLSNDDRP